MSETRELDENPLIDVDHDGRLCALTLEHARERTDVSRCSFEEVAA